MKKIKRNKVRSPLRSILNPSRLVFISLIGLAVTAYMLYKNTDLQALKNVQYNIVFFICFFLALLCIGIRDIAYMIRLKILADGALKWRQVFEVIFLWEFTSSITPSAIGGTPVAIFFLNKEGLNLGKATTVVLLTSLFDELFFIIMLPLLLLGIGASDLFPNTNETFSNFNYGIMFIFYTSYSLILFYCLIISYGLFINPFGIKKLLGKIFQFKLLQRWHSAALKTGDEIITASMEIKNKTTKYWTKIMAATFASWTARYLVINFLILGFTTNVNHVLIYGRQLVMWVIMLISPTPGGSGIAEFAFTVYLDEFIPDGLEGSLAVLWRLISYYLYLIIGVFILPRWIKRVYIKRKLISFKRIIQKI